MQNTLVSQLYKDDLLESLLSESPDITQKRINTLERLKALKKAKDILNDIREFDFD